MKISVVIPAYNVESTIQVVCQTISKSNFVNEVIVVDNNSTDSTFSIAKQFATKVIKCPQQGLGYAMKCGIDKSINDTIIKIDGDIKNPKEEWINLLISGISEDIVFANGYFHSDYDEFPVGNLVAKPSLRIRFPELDYIKMPLSGQYIFKKQYFNFEELPNDWAFDLAMLISAHKLKTIIGQINIGLLSDESKKISDYSNMAFEILSFIFNEN